MHRVLKCLRLDPWIQAFLRGRVLYNNNYAETVLSKLKRRHIRKRHKSDDNFILIYFLSIL